MKIKFMLLANAIVFMAFSTSLFAEVAVDMTATDVDKIKGTIRVRDLVVNDSARVYGGSLCINNGRLFLPDSVALSNKPVDDWGIDLKITILPGGKVRAETVMPKTTDKKRIKESIENFLSSIITPGIFDGGSQYCNDRSKTDPAGKIIKYLEIKSIDDMNSLRNVYKKLTTKASQ